MNNQSQNPLSIQALGKPIWENIYIVRMRYIDTLTTERIKNWGIPTVLDSGLDKQMHTQQITCGITIDQMVEYYRRGISFTLVHNAEAMSIYNIVNEYLLAWSHHIANNLNGTNPVHEDLLLLDEFAKKLYPQALMFGKVKPRENLLASHFQKTGHVGRDALFGQPVEKTVVKTEHSSISKEIVKSMSANPTIEQNRTSGRKGWK